MSDTLHIVRASAGSGKTYQLAANYIAKAINAENPRTQFRSILAVTFTNKATAEMKSRIIELLGQLSNGENSEFKDLIQQLTGMASSDIQTNSYKALCGILTDYSAFAISTIDAFFQRIVRSFFYELGLDVRYEVVLERKGALIEAIDQIVERSATDSALSAKISRLVQHKIDQGQRINFRKEFTALFDNAAQSGALNSTKISSDSAELKFDSLADMANTAKDRFIELCYFATELMLSHGISAADYKGQSRSFAAYFFKVKESSKIEKISKALTNVAREDSTAEEFLKKGAHNNDTATLLFDRLKNCAQELVTLNMFVKTFEAINNTYARYALLATLQQRINEIMTTRGELSLDTTPSLLRELTNQASVPFIFERLGTKYDTIFIDEFQDTSYAQWEAFKPLLEEAVSKSQQMAVMIIGDVKQAIYRWRGGDWTLLANGVNRDMGAGIIKNVSLNTSWRSEAEIVEFNNKIFKEVICTAQKKIETFVEESNNKETLLKQLAGAYDNFAQLIAPSKKLNRQGYVEVTRYDEEQTKVWIVETILEQLQHRNAAQVAILVRNKQHGALISQVLYDAGIQFVSDDVLTLGSSSIVCFVISVLRYMVSEDAVVLAAINHFLGKPFKTEISQEDSTLLNSIKRDELLSIIEHIVAHFKLEDKDLLYLQSLYLAAHEFSKQNPFDSIDVFIELWESKLSNSTISLGENKNAVRILTIHKSKGLEFDTVIVPYTQWSIFPAGNDNYMWLDDSSGGYLSDFGLYPIKYRKELCQTAFAEDYYREGVASVVDNVNLLYVALTRAAKELYIGLGDEVKSTQVGSLLDDAIPDERVVRYGEKSVLEANPKDQMQSTFISIESLESYELPPFYTD